MENEHRQDGGISARVMKSLQISAKSVSQLQIWTQRSLQKILILELMGYTEISVKDAWVVSILKSLINDRRVHFTLLKSFWSRVYWNVHQIFLGRLKILGYTEISIDDSRVYWNFRQSLEGILKIPRVYSNFGSEYWHFCRWFGGILIFYQCWRVYWLWLQGRRRRKNQYIWVYWIFLACGWVLHRVWHAMRTFSFPCPKGNYGNSRKFPDFHNIAKLKSTVLRAQMDFLYNFWSFEKVYSSTFDSWRFQKISDTPQ